MSALYQRARPVTFDEVVGQDHVKDVLTSAIRRGRVGHAYLFSGPRGVGKTTTARLLAMAVNCEAPAERRPCGHCESCHLVQAGSHPDVIELDAASNNSVEDVRDLRERAMLASMRGGTRVWILDEAHMLSKAAANALLKTLEEPPPGLMFILATTEPERLPPTVLSRCQHFRFRRLTNGEIVGKLARLAQGAGVLAETPALDLVARSADGGMRDAESLLDRLLATGEPVTLQLTEDALGLPPHEQLLAMATALATGNLSGLLDQAGSLYRSGFAPRTLAEQLARTLRSVLHAQLAGESQIALTDTELLRLLHALDDEQERFIRHDDLYSLEVALIKARNALTGNVPAAFTAQGAAPHEARQTTAPERSGSKKAEASSSAPAKPATTVQPTTDVQKPASGATPRDGGARAESAEPAVEAAPPSEGTPAGAFSWHAVRSRADVRLKAFLAPARVEQEDTVIRVIFPEANEFHHKQLLQRLGEFTKLVAEVAGPGYELVIDGPAGSSRASVTDAATGGGPKKA